jgi:TetR/AcrR family fatty acid metabolism transcriptional regulator
LKKDKMTARKVQAIETEKKIYQCAKELFRQYGVDNVTVDDIMEKVGMSKGTFFVHFASRDALLAAYISEYVNRLDEDYESYLKTFSDYTAASDILMAMVERVADNITEYVGYEQMKTAYRIQLEKTLDTGIILNHDRKIYKIISSLVNRGMQTGEFRTDIPAESVANHLVMAMRGATYEWCIRYPDFNLKNNLLRHFQILLCGIKKR